MSTRFNREFKGSLIRGRGAPETVSLVHESQTFWDDMRAPATAVKGGGSPPSDDTTNGCLLFSGSATNSVFITLQIPHTWYEGSTLKPHVHWQKTDTSSGDVLWQLDYKWSPINEVMDAAFTTLQATAVAAGTPDTDTADKHLITPLGDISGQGKQVSDMLICKLSRLGGDASDTYDNQNARFLEFDIHYEVDGLGTAQLYTKVDTVARL